MVKNSRSFWVLACTYPFSHVPSSKLLPWRPAELAGAVPVIQPTKNALVSSIHLRLRRLSIPHRQRGALLRRPCPDRPGRQGGRQTGLQRPPRHSRLAGLRHQLAALKPPVFGPEPSLQRLWPAGRVRGSPDTLRRVQPALLVGRELAIDVPPLPFDQDRPRRRGLWQRAPTRGCLNLFGPERQWLQLRAEK